MKHVVIIIIALTACGGSNPAPQPITLGFLAPLTGDIAAFGRDLTDASNLALEEINSGGGVLDNTELTLEVIDTGTTGTGASIGYTSLLNEGVPVILGPTASTECVAVQEQVKAGDTLTLSQSATSPELSTLDWGGYFYRLCPSDAVQSIVLAQQITMIAPPNLCIVERGDAYGDGLTAAVMAKLTIPTTIARFDPDSADLSHVLDPCDPLIAGTNNGILFITLVADGAQLMDDAATRGWTPAKQHVFLTDGTENHDLVTILAHPEFVEGAIGTAPTGPDPDSPDGVVLRDFQSRFLARFGRASDVYEEQSYDAVYIAALGIEIAKSVDDRPAIAQAMGSTISTGQLIPPGDWATMRTAVRADGMVDYQGASGDVTFDLATGDILPPYYIEVWTISNGAVTTISVQKITST